MTLFDFASFVGTVSFAISGLMVGVRKHLDILGLLITATLTALGGGIIRDILVDKTPNSLIDIYAPITVVSVVLLSIMIKTHKKKYIEQKTIFIISDAIGLVSFSITGALVGIDSGVSFFGVILLGFLTAVGGGIIRDMLINEIPVILISEFYGSVAVLISIFVYIFSIFDLNNYFFISLIAIFGIALRLLAYFQDWHLPKL